MLVLLLTELCFCLVNADLVPPFLVDGDGRRLGMWELSGAAVAYDDRIMLVPPIQYRTGAVWLVAVAPGVNWAIQIEMRIRERNGGCVCFCVSKQFGLTENETEQVVMATLRNDSKVELSLPHAPSKGTYTYDVDELMILNLYFANGNVVVSVVNPETKDTTDVFDFVIDMGHRFVGIQAQTNEKVALIELTSVTFHVTDERFGWLFLRRSVRTNGSGSYTPQIVERLRNPAFFATRIELMELEKLSGDLSKLTSPTNAMSLIVVIDELSQVSAGVATFNDLNTFLTTTISPYVDTWAKRTGKITTYMEETRSMTVSTCKTAKLMASHVGSIVNITITKTESRINTIQAELEDALIETLQTLNERMIQECESDIIARFIWMVTILEAVTVSIILFVLELCRSNRRENARNLQP